MNTEEIKKVKPPCGIAKKCKTCDMNAWVNTSTCFTCSYVSILKY